MYRTNKVQLVSQCVLISAWPGSGVQSYHLGFMVSHNTAFSVSQNVYQGDNLAQQNYKMVEAKEPKQKVWNNVE